MNTNANLLTFEVEVTDTYGGEANYSWVHRHTFTAPADTKDSALVRMGKKAAGYTGVPCDRTVYGETIQLDVRGACVRIFITPSL